MSIKLMTAVFEMEMEPVPKLLLLSLADFADEESGECWPSQARLAKKASIAERTVRSHLAELARAGYIAIISRGNGAGNTSVYRLNQERIKAAGFAAFSAPKADLGAAKADLGAKKADPACRRSVIDPSVDPSSSSSARAPARGELRVARAFRAYENCCGTMTPTTTNEILGWLDRHVAAHEWIEKACEEAARSNARSWRFIEKILERYEREGFGPRKPKEAPAARGAMDGRREQRRASANERW